MTLDQRISARTMPREDAEAALRTREALKAKQARQTDAAFRQSLNQAERELHAFGVYAGDVGVGKACFRRQRDGRAQRVAAQMVAGSTDVSALIAAQDRRLGQALSAFALQERCPAPHLLERCLVFDHGAYRDLRRLGWLSPSGLLPGSLTPQLGVSPLRMVAERARRACHTHRALPAA